MDPVTIAAAPEGAQLTVYRSTDPEVIPLSSVRFPDGITYSEWRPTEEELARLNRGEHIRLWVWTFGQPLQPVGITVTDGD